MLILGINAYHGGASAALLRNGQLVMAVEEERLNRFKYWAGFPTQAIQCCLSEAGIRAEDLDHIAIARDPKANTMRKAMWALRRRPNIGRVADRLINRGQVAHFDQTFRQALDVKNGLTAQFHHVEHHRAHLASAFFVSPFERAAVLSVDGLGDFVSTMWATGEGNSMNVRNAIHFPHSLGFLYTMVTQWLGFTSYGDEGKVMGLASYGDPHAQHMFDDLVRISGDGTFELNLDYFTHDRHGVEMSWRDGTPVIGPLYSERFTTKFGPARSRGDALEKRHQDAAGALQSLAERCLIALLGRVHADTGCDSIALAGGVALNSVFNGMIRSKTPFRNVFVQPAAGDAGTALGAAYYVHNQILGQPRKFVMKHGYHGPSFEVKAIEHALAAANLHADRMDMEPLCDAVAGIIDNGDVCGWYQGRMEWGPRALGHRSILADPRRAEMKDTLNARIKHREPFRPFAPSILEHRLTDYFDQSYPDPFMVMVYNVLPAKRSIIPAVTHVDGTGRLQTVSHEQSPEYASIITAFEKRTGVPVVLNTSFNENEPIVNTPAEAIDCFMRTRMDALAIGPYLIRKPQS